MIVKYARGPIDDRADIVRTDDSGSKNLEYISDIINAIQGDIDAGNEVHMRDKVMSYEELEDMVKQFRYWVSRVTTSDDEEPDESGQ